MTSSQSILLNTYWPEKQLCLVRANEHYQFLLCTIPLGLGINLTSALSEGEHLPNANQ